MSDASSHHLDMDQAEEAWDYLSEQVETFAKAWDTQGTPPDLCSHLPKQPLALRKMTLIELIKVDLEYRQAHNCYRDLQAYFDEFPELSSGGDIPCDLIYEDYHLRRKAGETITKHDYLDRFPNQRTQLQRLLGLDSPYQTTQLSKGKKREKHAAKAGDQLDDFDLYHEVGSGAFATVFLARQRSMQRLVALKISTDESDEPQALAQLDHANIVRVYDQRYLSEEKLRLLYMQFVPGGTLHDVLERSRKGEHPHSGDELLAAIDNSLRQRGDDPPGDSQTRKQLQEMTWSQAVAWLGSQLAEALSYAHSRGVLHRDIKPANVLLAADGRPKLADFNISYASEVEGAMPETFFGGSVAYMSPEQLEAYHPGLPRTPDDLDGRSDVYSLAVMLWELLAGRRPFEDRVLPEGWPATIERMHAERQHGVSEKAHAQLPTGCPAMLKKVLLKALAPDENERYADAGQFARDLALCRESHLSHLLHRGQNDWRSFVGRAPFSAFLLAVIIPNVCASVMNIAYNFQAIFEAENVDSGFFWNVELSVVNPVLYLSGILIGYLLARPALRGMRALRLRHSATGNLTTQAAHRTMWLGDLFWGIGMSLWVLSGVIFPAWTQWQAGHSVSASFYGHFIASQVVTGMIASAVAFFTVTFVCVRAALPRLLAEAPPSPELSRQLVKLSKRAWVYLSTLVVAPFAAVFILSMNQSDIRWAFTLIALVGVASFLASALLARLIQQDLSALARIVDPAGDYSSFGVESSLTGSRRM
ncbi:MAG: protein kinase [Pirellulales bacterium]|nr:protein kinase [Pirellulales bacterium]